MHVVKSPANAARLQQVTRMKKSDLCPHTAIYVSSYYYICPHTTIYARLQQVTRMKESAGRALAAAGKEA